MADELISRQALLDDIQAAADNGGMGAVVAGTLKRYVKRAPAVDAVEVVRCAQCKHGIWDEDEEMYKCVNGAEYDEESGEYYGFIAYSEADFYCADGKRREENAAD